MPKFISKWQYKPCGVHAPVGESVTEPDLAYSVSDMLRMFENGTLRPEDVNIPEDYSDQGVEDVINRPSDLAELDVMSDDYNSYVESKKVVSNEYKQSNSDTGVDKPVSDGSVSDNKESASQ